MEETVLTRTVPYQILVELSARVYCGFSVLLPWSVCVFFCQYHAALMTVALGYSWRSGSWASSLVLLSQDCFGSLGPIVFLFTDNNGSGPFSLHGSARWRPHVKGISTQIVSFNCKYFVPFPQHNKQNSLMEELRASMAPAPPATPPCFCLP